MKTLLIAALIGCSTTPPPASPEVRPPAPTQAARPAASSTPSLSVFAVYIARMHRSIHAQWADGMLAQHRAKDPDGWRPLWVLLELAIAPDGSLHKVVVAKTSGSVEFDAAALDAVVASGPFEPPPPATRSGDELTYLRWGFYGDERDCAVTNVKPYVLPGSPR